MPSFAEVRSVASKAAYQAAHPLLEADEPAAVGDPELAGERLDRGALLAVADDHELRVDALLEQRVTVCGPGRVAA